MRVYSKKQAEAFMEQRIVFRRVYAEELNIDDLQEDYPEWVHKYREPMLDRISNPTKQLCRLFKENNVWFKIKCPIKTNTSYKFCDIYIPDIDAIVMIKSKKDSSTPTLFSDEKADLFAKNHEVYNLSYDSVNSKDSTYKRLCKTLGIV